MFCDVRSMGTPIDAKSLLGLASNGWFTQQSMEFHVMCYLMLYDMVQIYLMYTLPQRWASRTMGLESSFLIRTSQFFFFPERLVRLTSKHVVPFCSSMFDCLSRSIKWQNSIIWSYFVYPIYPILMLMFHVQFRVSVHSFEQRGFRNGSLSPSGSVGDGGAGEWNQPPMYPCTATPKKIEIRKIQLK